MTSTLKWATICPPWKTKRCDSNKVKAEQLERTGAKIVVTPCPVSYTHLTLPTIYSV